MNKSFFFFSDEPALDNADGNDVQQQDEDSAVEEDEDNEPPQKKTKNKPSSYRWRKTKPPVYDTTFLGKEFSLPLAEDLTPMQYFNLFWSDDITENLVTQTNLYSVQKSGKSIDINKKEMERFIGIQMLMSIVSLPSYELYWSKELRVDCVANVMSLKRYELIRRYLHANDNAEKNENSSRLFKVEPVVNTLRTNYLSVEQEQYQSIDEQMVPAKTKRSGIRQYMPKKIHKWGFKNFVCAGASGIIYDFFFYAGQKSAGREKCGSSEVVLRLVEELPKNQNFQLFMDNWFSTLSLLSELKSIRILTIATFRSNRLGGCPLMAEKDLKACGRHSFDYQTDGNTGLHFLKWFDNKCVIVGSSFAGIECHNMVQRYDQAKKEKGDDRLS